MPAQPYLYGTGAASAHQLATPGSRILARLIDGLIMLVVIAVPYIVLFAAAGSSEQNDFGASEEFTTSDGVAMGALLFILALGVLGPALYEIAFVALKGATPGKMAMGVRVVRDADGALPGWGTATLRWLPNLASAVCGLAGPVLLVWSLIALFSNAKRQTPFDLTASTVVVKARP